jgi:hypothetical protein
LPRFVAWTSMVVVDVVGVVGVVVVGRGDA